MSLKKRAMISFLAVGLAFSMPLQVGATATQKKNEAQQNLDSTNRQIQNLKEDRFKLSFPKKERNSRIFWLTRKWFSWTSPTRRRP